MSDLSFIRYEKEKIFAQTFFDHPNWTYQPGPFYVEINGEQKRFTPDFWDGERDVYIEVVGSKQAFHSNKLKYKTFLAIHKNFEVRKFDTHETYECENIRFHDKGSPTQREAAKKLKLSPEHLNSVIRGRIRPSLNLALRIENLMGVPVEQMIPELEKKVKGNFRAQG